MSRAPLAVALICTAAVALGACGGSSGSGDTRTVSNSKIPFMFKIPTDYKDRTVQQGSSQGTPPLVTVGPDRFNLIDVRQSAAREVSATQVESQITESLAQLGFAGQTAKRETHSGKKMVMFRVDNKVSGTATQSKLYFFGGGGGTWELECQSTSAQRDSAAKACNTAINSIKFA